MTTPTHNINVPLARRILDQIIAVPRRWRQGVWLERPYAPEQQSAENTVDNCLTYGCFAGWTVVLSGYRTPRHPGFVAEVLDVPDDVLAQIADLYHVDDRRDVHMSVRSVAAVELGLTARQADRLFEGSNTYRQIVTMLHDWTGGEIELPADDEWPPWADLDDDQMDDRFAEQDGDEDEDAS